MTNATLRSLIRESVKRALREGGFFDDLASGLVEQPIETAKRLIMGAENDVDRMSSRQWADLKRDLESSDQLNQLNQFIKRLNDDDYETFGYNISKLRSELGLR